MCTTRGCGGGGSSGGPPDNHSRPPHPHPSFALLLIFQNVDFNSQLLMADLSAMILLVSVGALLLGSHTIYSFSAVAYLEFMSSGGPLCLLSMAHSVI